jgi:hypothetical protein
MISIAKKALAALVCGLVFAAAASAQDTAKKGVVLTHESLGAMLENLGYDAKSNKEGTYYTIQENRSDFTFVYNVGLSSDKKNVWITSSLRQWRSDVAKERFASLMAAADQYPPAFFTYHPQTHWVRLKLCVRNADITPAVLKEHIDQFKSCMQNTVKLWDPAQWTEEKPQTTQPTRYDPYLNEFMDAMTEVAEILKTVRDEASAQAALPRLQAQVERIERAVASLKGLGQPTPEEEKRFSKAFHDRSLDVGAKNEAEWKRIEAIKPAMAILRPMAKRIVDAGNLAK